MNITMIIEMAAESFPDRIAVTAGNETLTYGQLLQRSLAVAEIVRGNGSSYTAVLDENCAAIPAALFGSAFARTPYAPLNYRLTGGELEALLRRVAPATLFTTDTATRSLAIPADIAAVDRSRLITDDRTIRMPESFANDGQDIAVQLFTSGTTGKPKAAILRHENLMSYILGTVEFAAAEETDATLITVPPYHIAGISAVLSSVYAGRRMVLLESFDARTWLKTCQKERITNAFVVPTMLLRIIDEIDNGAVYDLSSLSAIAFGGGKMPLSVVTRAMELLPYVDFTNAYGLTETSSTICLLGPDDHREAAASGDPKIRRRLGSVGRAIGTVEIEIRDDCGSPVASELSGDIFVRGGQVAGEYLEIGSGLDDSGWFPTRDRGFLDADGFLFLEGRADDVIVRGGENISPGEIEDVLLDHPGVLEAVIVAIPDESWGEAIGAAVVARPNADVSAAELQDWVKTRLRSSRVPSMIQFRSELPYNELGKVLRRIIRDDLKKSLSQTA
jgi:acyl-CoA synthetase (AMP-forming)/AMP-acid ligase II